MHPRRLWAWCRKQRPNFSKRGALMAAVALQVPAELERLLEVVKGKRLILEIGTALGGTLLAIPKKSRPQGRDHLYRFARRPFWRRVRAARRLGDAKLAIAGPSL